MRLKQPDSIKYECIFGVMRKSFVIAIVLFWVLSSCISGNGSENKKGIDDVILDDNTMSIKMDTIPIDSIFLQELEEAYMNGGVLWGNESKSNPPDGSEGMYCIVSHKLMFNADTIEDYFLTEYESRFAESYIIDGRTGRKIPFTHDSLQPVNRHTMFWHRPTDNGVVATVVDVDCGDEREELMVNYTMGSSGFGSYLLLYKYNKQTDKVDLIFQYTIYEEIISDDTNKILRNSLNYIDMLYDKSPCITEINIYPAKSIESIDYQFDYLDIEPLPDIHPITYVFNSKTNLFERKSD